MREKLFVLIICIGYIHVVHAQDTIGSIPPGTSIVNDIIDLRLADELLDTITYLDVDGDGTQDIKIWLHNGYPPADDAHSVLFFILNNSLSFCTDGNQLSTTFLYDLGDTICTTGQQWGTEELYIVGCHGGWNCFMDSITDQYLAYKKIATDEIGWMRVSATLLSGVTPDSITFTISELLALNQGTGIHTTTSPLDFKIFPNPTTDGQCYIQCNEKIKLIDLFNAQGQYLKTYQGESNRLTLPEAAGMYFVKVSNDKGQFAVRKMIRQ